MLGYYSTMIKTADRIIIDTINNVQLCQAAMNVE